MSKGVMSDFNKIPLLKYDRIIVWRKSNDKLEINYSYKNKKLYSHVLSVDVGGCIVFDKIKGELEITSYND